MDGLHRKESKGLEIIFNRHRQKCEEDFKYFCKNELLIDSKGGGQPQPFMLNRAQQYVFQRLTEQSDRLGFIRANILKGRQQGMSTLTAGLIFWKCAMKPCMNATLVSKDFKATKALFDKIKRFAYTRPIDNTIQVAACNQDEMRLSNDSLIRCSTARADQVSRGSTNQLLFLSEAPYWENGIEQVSALFDSIGRVPGTMVIMESTAKGKDPLFYANYQMGLNPDSDWQSIFVPWFWQEEYSISLTAGENFVPTASEQELIDRYGLKVDQLKWRRNKILEYRKSDPLGEFKREYPCCEEDAFEVTENASFFDIERVKGAMSNRGFESDNSGMVLGIDVGAGTDPSVCCFREGPNVSNFIDFSSDSLINTRHWIEDLIRTYRPKRCFVDSGGVGLGVVQELMTTYGGVVRGVNFGESADDSECYANKRAEMFDRLRAFMNNETVSICGNDDLLMELKVIRVEPDKAKLTIISKDKIRKEIGRSTNYLDALALTFAEEVAFGRNGGNQPDVIQLPPVEPNYMNDQFFYSSGLNIGL